MFSSLKHSAAANLRAIAAIATLSIRAAIRSRMVMMLLIALAAGVFGLPRLMIGNASAAGAMQVQLRYTLMFAGAVLGMATLWASAAALGAEVDNRRFELTAVKPVRPLVLWLGRWLGILLLDALLLTAVMLTVRVQLGVNATALPASRAVARPVLLSPEDEARRVFENLRRNGQLPDNMSSNAVMRQLIRECGNRYEVVRPAEKIHWQFHLSQPVPADGRLWLRMRFDTDALALADVHGVCRLRQSGATTWATEKPVNDLVRNALEIQLTTPALAGANDLEAEFDNLAPTGAAPILVQSRREVFLLTPEGTFDGNLLRVLLAFLAILAALAALGLTLGACFSFPVAAFIATVLTLVVVVSDDVLDETDPCHVAFVDRISAAVVHGAQSATKPLLAPEPLSQTVEGERVPTPELQRMLLWGFVIYPALLAWIACVVLRRRELVRGA